MAVEFALQQKGPAAEWGEWLLMVVDLRLKYLTRPKRATSRGTTRHDP